MRPSAATGAAAPATAAPTTPWSTPRPDRRCPSPTTRSPPTNAANRDYAVPTYLALRADRPFSTVSSGFVGTASDGLTQLDANHTLTPTTPPWVATSSRPPLSISAGDREFDPRSRLRHDPGIRRRDRRRHGAHLATPAARAYAAGWLRYDAGLRRPSAHLAGLTGPADSRGARVLRVRQRREVQRGQDLPRRDRRVAGIAVGPGGLRRRPREHLLRLLPRGLRARPLRGVDRAADRRRPVHGTGCHPVPAGTPATTRRLDAPQLAGQRQACARHVQHPTGRSRLPDPHGLAVRPGRRRHPVPARQAGRQLPDLPWAVIRAGTLGGAERLLAVHDRRRDRRAGRRRNNRRQHAAPADARIWFATADQYQRTIKGWSVTTNGPLSPQPYFIRLSKTGDPNAAISYDLGNGGPTLDQRSVIDAGFLELVRLGELSATDPDVPNSLDVVDATIEKHTPSGPAGCATTATGMATATSPGPRLHPRGSRGRRRTRERGTSGRCCPQNAGSRIWPPAGHRSRSPARRHRCDVLGRRPGPRAGLGLPEPSPRRRSAPIRRRPRSVSSTANPTDPPRL